MKRYEYKTTDASYDRSGAPDPEPPDGTGTWELRGVATDADYCRMYWAWQREIGAGS